MGTLSCTAVYLAAARSAALIAGVSLQRGRGLATIRIITFEEWEDRFEERESEQDETKLRGKEKVGRRDDARYQPRPQRYLLRHTPTRQWEARAVTPIPEWDGHSTFMTGEVVVISVRS